MGERERPIERGSGGGRERVGERKGGEEEGNKDGKGQEEGGVEERERRRKGETEKETVERGYDTGKRTRKKEKPTDYSLKNLYYELIHTPRDVDRTQMFACKSGKNIIF